MPVPYRRVRCPSTVLGERRKVRVGALQQRIFTQLGLVGTSFPVTDPDIAGYHAHGYLLPGNPFIPTDVPIDVTRFNPSWAWAAGAVISTGDDLARFYQALLGARLLRPALLSEMLTTVQVDPVFGYGLGIYSLRTVCGTVWGHDGGVPGYVTFAFNNRQGTRNMVLMMSTIPDAQTGPLLDLALGTAACNMLDQDASRAVPMPTQVTRTAAPNLLR
jgi:D-alanyl-D-alanine carboxypeptidase